jgi:hypothetical protein
MFKSFFILFNLLFCQAGSGQNINWQLPTLGGLCFWTDTKVNQGCRIQKNVLTGHFRLLNADDYRIAWGTYDDCLTGFSSLAAPLSTSKKVLLIHGLTIKKNSLEPLQKCLEEEGYEVEYFRFSCFYEPLEKTAKSLANVLSGFKQKSHIVTHSTGAILMRQYEEDYDSKGVDKIAMLTAPNNGVLFVDRLRNLSLSGLLGVNGKRLHSGPLGLGQRLPEPSVDFITISGSNRDSNYYFPLTFLSDSHDGLLTTKTGALLSAQMNYVVKAHHFTIMNKTSVKEIVTDFFESP